MDWKKRCDAALFKLRAVNMLFYSISICGTSLSLLVALVVIVQSRDPRAIFAITTALIFLAFKASGFYRQWTTERSNLLKQYEFETMLCPFTLPGHDVEVKRIAAVMREVSPESAFAVLQSPIIHQENYFTLSFSPAAVCRITAEQDLQEYSSTFTALLNKDELLFVVAHETGHVRCGVRSLSVAARLLHVMLVRSIFALYLITLALIYASASPLYGFGWAVLLVSSLLIGLMLRGIAAHREEFIADLYAARELKLKGGDPLVTFTGLQLSVHFYSNFCLPLPVTAKLKRGSHPSMQLRQRMLEQVFG